MFNDDISLNLCHNLLSWTMCVVCTWRKCDQAAQAESASPAFPSLEWAESGQCQLVTTSRWAAVSSYVMYDDSDKHDDPAHNLIELAIYSS